MNSRLNINFASFLSSRRVAELDEPNVGNDNRALGDKIPIVDIIFAKDMWKAYNTFNQPTR